MVCENNGFNLLPPPPPLHDPGEFSTVTMLYLGESSQTRLAAFANFTAKQINKQTEKKGGGHGLVVTWFA